MKTYIHSFSCSNMISPVNRMWNFYPFNTFESDQLCYFDIETTGLSSEAASIYLIGAGCYSDNTFTVTQWFADDYKSEKEILISFLDYIREFKVIFQYNGNAFDIPFIRKKCKLHSVDCSILNGMKCIDLYISLRRYGDLLGLPNRKLKSFERYVGLNRDDIYDGGQLIRVYSEYMQAKYLHRDNDELLRLLLLHNCEDITGLSQVASLLFLKEISQIPIKAISVNRISENQNNYIEIKYSCQLPGSYTFKFGFDLINSTHSVYCSWSQNKITLRIPIISDTLRYFFTDYKDYYYMINENTVMHKSVAIYTDASVRRKAKKSECYIEKNSCFIPINKKGCFSDKYHIFNYDYTSKDYYIELTSDILNSADWFEKYYSQLF